MNWRGWMSGFIVTCFGAAVTAINAIVVQMNPIPEEWKIYLITLPAFLTGISTFLMRSPLPGSTGIALPPEVITGIPEGGTK